MSIASGTVRAAAVSLALLAVSLTAACGAPGEPTSCDEPGSTYSQVVPVILAATDEWDETTVFLVCTPEETVAIVDEQGNDYISLEDFQRNNELFDEGDQMLVIADFPAIDSTGELQAVPAKTPPITLWQVVGLVALAAVVVALVLFLLSLRRRASATGLGEAFTEE